MNLSPIVGSDVERRPQEEGMGDRPYPMETQLALIRRDIEEIHHALHGDSKGRKGLVDQVEDLVTVADRGRFSLRVALWLGGGVVAAATAIAQFKQAIQGLFHQ